ncbi:MAG: hypothetical protein AAF664_01530 [Planctomycetota bacterium]
MIRLITVSTLFVASTAFGQNTPLVDDLIKSLDINQDGKLTANEVAENKRYSKQFPRWDTDEDQVVSREDIVAFRYRFGISADGTPLRRSRSDGSRGPGGVSVPFNIPDIGDLSRIGKGRRPSSIEAQHSQYLLSTSTHAVSGSDYVVLTDHNEAAYLTSLNQLAKHHGGKLVRVSDLAIAHDEPAKFRWLREQVKNARYVAIAPRLVSFRENMVLGMWELLSTIDDDPMLDCFPGFLVASSPQSFALLINQSIEHKSTSAEELRPFAINQVQNSQETRSLQKSGILRKHFQKIGLHTPIVAIYGPTADEAPRLKGEQTWNLKIESRREFVRTFEDTISLALAKANLVVMHGHGVPGMSCSVDVDAVPDDCTGKILLSGSCFSANPVRSDLAAMSQAPGGYQVEARDAFIVRAIDNGAIAAFGHQRLSSGFVHLYPVLESWLDGQSIGQGYQQMINGLIEQRGAKSGDFVLSKDQLASRNPRQQSFLYIVIGDPALQPFEMIKF